MRIASLALALLCIALAPAAVRAAPDDPPNSIYRLAASLVDQDGRALGLDVDRGHPVLVTMFYGGCQATCPLIIDTLRALERRISSQRLTDLRVLMISIDPEHDTAEALSALAHTRHIDTTRWTLVRTDETTVRKIAALLDVQYRRLPDGGYNHSTVIALLSPRGEIEERSSALGHVDELLVARLRAPAAGRAVTP